MFARLYLLIEKKVRQNMLTEIHPTQNLYYFSDQMKSHQISTGAISFSSLIKTAHNSFHRFEISEKRLSSSFTGYYFCMT